MTMPAAAPGAPTVTSTTSNTGTTPPAAGGQAPADTGTTTTSGTITVGPNGTTWNGLAPDAVTGAHTDGRPVGDDAQRGGDDGKQGETPTEGKADPAKPGQAPGAEKVEDLPDWAQKIIKDARQGEGDYRKRATAAEAQAKSTEDKLQNFLDGFSKVLGLQADEAEESAPDPEKLTNELANAQKEHRATQVELAVYRAAGQFGGDPDALLDSRSFLNKVLSLDPSGDEFGQQVASAIKEAVASNPKLKAPVPQAPAPAAPSGGEFAGGPSGRTDAESLSVDDFRKRRSNRRG